MDYEEALAHYGIKGMRWGVRKDRRSKSKRQPSPDRAKVDDLKKKRYKELTNEELRVLNNRLNMEKQYKDLKKQDMTAGQKILNDIMDALIKQATSTLVNYSKQELEKYLTGKKKLK